MTNQFYVATDRDGVQRHLGQTTVWNLPQHDGTSWQEAVTSLDAGSLVLMDADELLENLDELIFIAQPDGDGATLVAGTKWDPVVSAVFALDCAEHVIGTLDPIALPDGSTVASVIADARKTLQETTGDVEKRLGRLARLSASRRLRRQGDALSDVAREILTEDVLADVDALDDENYVKTAAAVDAVLAAVESIRHFALPRYMQAREQIVDAHDDSEPAGVPSQIATPWGNIAIGAEHHSPYAPSWVASRDAASRARDAAVTSGGDANGATERAWQAQHLASLL